MAPNEPSATGDVAATQAGGKASVLEADLGSVPADAKSGAKLGAFHKVISRTSPVLPPGAWCVCGRMRPPDAF